MEFTEDGYASYGGLAYGKVPLDEAHVIIQGIPYESASSGKKGASFAPSVLRVNSVDLQTLSRDGIDLNQMIVRDIGNIPIYPLEGEKTRNSIEQYTSYLMEQSNAPIISIGGDHSCTYPLLKSLASRGTVGIIWFDAHRDLLSALLGSRFSHGSPLGRAIELTNISPENVLLIGTRYMHQEEQTIVEENGIEELRMVDLEQDNFNEQKFLELVKKISQNVDNIYVSIDIDVLDPAFAPGTGTPVGGGLTSSQLMRFIRSIPVDIRAIDIMEVAPPIDNTDITIKATMSLLTEILTKLWLQQNN